MQVDMTLTNHGLIAANDLKFSFSDHPFYKIEPLINNIESLGAKSSLTVPVRITRIADFDTLTNSSNELSTLATPQVPCSISVSISYDYECAGQKIERDIPIPVFNVEGNCTSGGSGGWIGRGSSGGGRVVPIEVNLQDSNCDPCKEKNLQALSCIIRSLGGRAKGIIGGVVGGINCWVNIANGIKDFKEGNYLDLPKPSELCDPPDPLDCLENLCFEGLGGSDGPDGLSLTINALTPTNVASGIQTLQRYTTYWGVLSEVALNYYGDEVWLKVSDENQPILQAWHQAFKEYAQGDTIEDLKISDTERQQLLTLAFPQPLTSDDVNKFIARWNRNIEYYSQGIFRKADLSAGQNPDFMAIDDLQALKTQIDNFKAVLESEGYEDLYDATLGLSNELYESISGQGGVCATVKIKIDQEAVMTRSAFLGNLEIDNGNSTNLENISVTLQITDQNGNIVNNLFGITNPTLKNITAVDGTGILTGDDPNTSQNEGLGSAEWTFIPTNLAAPQTATNYNIGGTLSYTENGQVINVPLLSTGITVLPQAELYLDYFQSRNVYGDDPFTDTTEISVPFDLAVLVQNKGYGDAKNLRITSSQPKIVDNEKGLLIDFNIIGSQLNGQDVTPSLKVNFGDIKAGQTAVANWLLKSTLQGKFIEYKATFEHKLKRT
jgi:hypothetical protein